MTTSPNFRNLRKCDRFWYEGGNPLIRFTEAQLVEIRKISLAKITCDNCDAVSHIQRAMFDVPDPFLNPRVPCSALPAINLDLWKERVSCTVGNVGIEIGDAKRISPCTMCTCTKEGPVCQSLKIENCFHLAQAFSPEAILKVPHNYPPSSKVKTLNMILGQPGIDIMPRITCCRPSKGSKSSKVDKICQWPVIKP